MSEWYYADRQRRQIGPLPAAELAQLFRDGQVDAATLVWREGLPGWQPLGGLREELGLGEPPAAVDFRTLPATPPAAPAAPAPLAYAHAGEVVHAGLWRRFAASVIDGLVTSVVVYAVLIPLMLAFGVSLAALAQTDPSAGGPPLAFMATYYAVSLSIPALYFAWMHSSATQASLGKMAVGVKVVRGDGQRVGFGRALLRYVAYIVFAALTCGLGVLVSGLMVAMTERKQAPHDMLCDTLVVDRWAFTAHPERQQHGLGTVTVVVLVLFGLMIVATVVVAALAIAALAAQHG